MVLRNVDCEPLREFRSNFAILINKFFFTAVGASSQFSAFLTAFSSDSIDIFFFVGNALNSVLRQVNPALLPFCTRKDGLSRGFKFGGSSDTMYSPLAISFQRGSPRTLSRGFLLLSK